MRVTIEGLPELKRSLERFRRELRTGTEHAVIAAVDAGRQAARTHHHYESRSPDGLESSTGGHITSVTDNSVEGEIFALSDHASFINDGTPAHPIHPKAGNRFIGPLKQGQSRRKRGEGRASVLRWEGPDGVHFATMVNHPGTKPDPFMTYAHDEAERVLDETMQREADRAAERV